MNLKYKEYLLSEIFKISQKAIRGKAPEYGIVKTYDFEDPIRGNWSFSLLEKDIELYQRLSSKTLDRMPGSEKFTEKTLRNFIFDLLESAVYGENIDFLKKQLNHRLELIRAFNEKNTIYVPIEGLELEYDDIKIGEVTFKQIRNKILLEKMGLYGTESYLCAEYTTIAEPQRALEKAINEARLSVDVIRFALSSLPHSDIKPLIGIEGEVPKSFSRYLVQTSVSSEKRQMLLEVNRGRSKIKVDLDYILEKTNSHIIFDILSSETPTNFERAILSSIQWFAHADKESVNSNKILSLITCLETFLSGEYGNPIRNTVAEGCALVTKKSLEDRKVRKERINDFYKKRSSISHGSSSKEIIRDEISELTAIVQEFIQKMIDRRSEFQNTGEFMGWINDVRLS